MNIWIIDHYSVPQKYYPLIRNTIFAKKLNERGHEVTIFAASTVHNSKENLVPKGKLYKEVIDNDVRYVLIRCNSYADNGLKRRLNMLDFALKLPSVCRHYNRPDVIISTSMTPFACAQGIRIAKKYKCKKIAQITDLWPESIVAYGYSSRKNLVIRALYILEKWICKNADAIVFSMEGGRDYIIGKGWDIAHGGPIDLKKVHHINNGVDLEVFDYNKSHFVINDADLCDQNAFKVIYTGSIRKVNAIHQLIEVADILQQKGASRIKFLIFGDGDEREHLEREVKQRNLNNIKLKGRIKKEQIPYVLSKADLCLLHWKPTPITKFGMSMNKFFEYFAAGKPILSNSVSGYDLIQRYKCGISKNISTPEEYVECIMEMSELSESTYNVFCNNARIAAEDYDFSKLTDKLVSVIEGTR